MPGEPRTRIDKVVWLRERAARAALKALARARAEADRAGEQASEAARAASADDRAAGPVELWQLDDAAHGRALQALRAATAQVDQAKAREASALGGYATAHGRVEAVRRVQERRRSEVAGELRRRERRDVDEIATLRFNVPR